MMKRFLMILVMVSWCSVGIAEILKLDCTPRENPTGEEYEYLKYEINTDPKLLHIKWKWVGHNADERIFNIIEVDKTKVVYTSPALKDFVWSFNYGGDGFEYRIKPTLEKLGNIDCKIVSGSLTDTKKIEIASMIDKAKDTCKDLGFNEGTEKFADCALKLYSQSVELAAKQNQQIVMQPQSSGSNVMTIYDPVRDSNALMDKGMKMITGRCTLGYNC